MSVRFYWTDILVIRLFDVNRSYQFIDLSFIFSLPMLQLLRMHHDKCMFTCCDYIWFGSKMPNSILTHKSNQLSLFPLYQRPIFVILDHNNMCFTCTDKVTYRFSFFTSSQSDCLSNLASSLDMCCLFASKCSSSFWICKLCDSCNAARALLSLDISSTNATIWKQIKEKNLLANVLIQNIFLILKLHTIHSTEH